MNNPEQMFPVTWSRRWWHSQMVTWLFHSIYLSDELFGDFEDLETGEKHGANNSDEVDSSDEKGNSDDERKKLWILLKRNCLPCWTKMYVSKFMYYILLENCKYTMKKLCPCCNTM